MNKQEFLSAFQRAMESLGVKDQAAHYGFFEELFSDMGEEGIREEEISARLGDPWELAASLLREEEDRGTSGRKREPPFVPVTEPNEQSGTQEMEERAGREKVEKFFSWRNGFLRLLRGPGKIQFDLNLGSRNSEEQETRIPVSGIEELEINWRAGELEIGSENREDILLTEYRGENDPPMRTEVRGSCLYVFYAERPCGSKDLNVLLPKALADSLRRCIVSTISADASLSAITVREFKLNSVSGNQEVRLSAEQAEFSSASGDLELDVQAEMIEAKTASGDVSLTAANSAEIIISTASGDIECRGTTRRLTLNSASGDVSYSGTADEIQVKTASGDCGLALEVSPNRLDVTSVSGDVDVKLPEGCACNLQLNSRSGDIRFSGIRTDVKEAPFFNFHTVSGDIDVHS